jgi:hypothetical protein
MRKCICGGYKKAGTDNNFCPRCFALLTGEQIIDATGLELVAIADPIFTEGVENFVEDKQGATTQEFVESYMDVRNFTGNICDFLI